MALIQGTRSLKKILTGLKVYNYSDVSLDSFFKIDDQVNPFQSLFFVDWNKGSRFNNALGFKDVWLKTNEEKTPPIETPLK